MQGAMLLCSVSRVAGAGYASLEYRGRCALPKSARASDVGLSTNCLPRTTPARYPASRSSIAMAAAQASSQQVPSAPPGMNVDFSEHLGTSHRRPLQAFQRSEHQADDDVGGREEDSVHNHTRCTFSLTTEMHMRCVPMALGHCRVKHYYSLK